MAGTLDARSPTQQVVRNLVQNQSSITTGTYQNAMSVSIAIPASGGSLLGWINPESGTVVAQAVVYFSVAGTGTIDVGVTDDGTASANTMINGGTMALGGVISAQFGGTAAASMASGVAVGTTYAFVGPGGTGTNNSISLSHNEAATGTAVGRLVINYFPLGE